MVSTFKYLTVVVSSHSDIYETCVKRNLDQKICLLAQRQPLQITGHWLIGNKMVLTFKYLTVVVEQSL